MKRELAFALESGSQFSHLPGRTRSSKPSSDQLSYSRRKTKKRGSVDRVVPDGNSVNNDQYNGVEEVVVEEEGVVRAVGKVYVKRKRSGSGVNANTGSVLAEEENVEGMESGKDLGLKVCEKKKKKSELVEGGKGKVPSNMRELLETGLLEGLRVWYDLQGEEKNLQGMIKGIGILCSCKLCMGTQVISASQFEMHARHSYRQAIKFIRFENGKSLLEVIEICKALASESMEVALQAVTSSLPVKGASTCTKCNGLIDPSSTENLLICYSCLNKKHEEESKDHVNKSTPKRFTRSALVDKENLEESVTPTELKMSKKIGFGRMPSNLRDLLETGLLEGFRVFYDFDTEGKKLQGMIKGVGILCSCNMCAGNKVISASQFEMHACKSYRHAIKHIRLENGKSLLEVIEICKASSSDSVEVALQTVISSLPVMGASTCTKCNGLIGPSSTENLLICDSCLTEIQVEAEPSVATRDKVRTSSPEPKESESNSSSISFDQKNKPGRKRKRKSSKSVLKSVRRAGNSKLLRNKLKSKILKRSPRSASVPRFIKSVTKFTSSQQESRKKLTIKNNELHWAVFQKGGLPDGTELTYVAFGKKCLEGYKLDQGIFCSCCQTVISPSLFEAHAGRASNKKPYANIYISNGVSLHEYAVSLKKTENRRRPSKYNDDLCRVCSDGGALLLCDGCPRSFHQECVGEECVPRGKWYCQYCQQSLKYVGKSANALAAGRVAGTDYMEQIMTRCIRIVKHSENCELVACVLCRSNDFSKKRILNDQTVIVCDQCEKEYHIGCLREHNMADLKELPKGNWFCHKDCERINSVLKNLITREPKTLPDDLLTFLREKQNNDNNSETDISPEMKFVVLSAKNATCETRKLLAQSVKIFHEGFDPIIDATSGRDFIPSMVYGRKIWSQDFAGMLCAILTINSKVVTAGTLRVFSEDLAELPIVATSKCNQGKGYFQLLFTCIERLLSSLKVKKIVLPAAEEAKSIWTKKFGFATVAPNELSELRQSCSAMMTFQGTSMLQKEIPQAQDGVADAGDHGLFNSVTQ